jgi:hypothetical protein
MASVSPAAELELLQLIADARTTNYLAGESSHGKEKSPSDLTRLTSITQRQE